ncbi:ArsR/SmtB family transcription factor [Pseudothauera rhizosphaerae]|uniref:Winged helix-turn-helix transcriptional regulator n=1 Tax=Pseudothauera rhizosphaerae TaxID=2565932 RepID=A0A4S4AS02_9RHOO|nr:metalloregulator ArsR/SmtB family transcription factor [Pseudothauera rhizosphaerae]THF62643.1 winged helix-turn-helix transcriptional regulator [Pseudothauera rhizosphaerae]
MDDYVESLKALADPQRLRVFWLLAHIDERICVAEAMDVLGVSHYNASRQLSQLKKGKLVKATREGKRVFYTLNRQGGPFVDALLAAVRTIPPAGLECEIASCRRLLQIRNSKA